MTASPPAPSATVGTPLSRAAVETAVARTAAGFGVAFLLQSIPALIDQAPNMSPMWTAVVLVALIVSVVNTGIAAILGRWVRATAACFAIVYALAVLSWPFAVINPADAPQANYWLYYTLNVGTVMATIGFRLRWAIAYLFLLPAIYAYVRVTDSGGHVSPLLATLDSVYAVILGGVVTVISTILRRVADAVDRSQRTALDRYAQAVRQHAAEAERVRVDSLVHDSVLTTLLSAARAYTPEAKALAASMADDAIQHLRDALRDSPETDATVTAVSLAHRLQTAAETMSRPFAVRIFDVQGRHVPLAVAEAIYSASVQAMVNSLQHAGRADRWVEVRGTDAPNGVAIEVGDSGVGFDFAEVPTERLGVRVSIIERTASAGGRAEVVSAPGEGTRILLRWPDDRPAVAAPPTDELAVSEWGDTAPDEWGGER